MLVFCGDVVGAWCLVLGAWSLCFLLLMADGSRLCSVLGAFDGSAFDGSFIAASNTAMYSPCIHGDGQQQIEQHGAVKPRFNEPL